MRTHEKEASEFIRLGMTVNLEQPIEKYSIKYPGDRCVNCEAISYNSKVIVLDEPTSSLTGTGG